MSGDEIFGYGWREDHARKGDDLIVRATVLVEKAGTSTDGRSAVMTSGMVDFVRALAAIAQAHYAAANIRTRPIRDAELP